MRGRRSNLPPPGPRGSLLTGNLQAYEEDRLGFLMRARHDYGPVVSFDARTTIINSADLADQVLRDPSKSFEVSQNFLGQHLTSAQIETVMDVRRLLNPGLRPSALADVPHSIAALTHRHLASMDRVMSIDPVRFGEDVLAEAFSWHLFGAGQAPVLRQVSELLDSLEEVIGNVFAAPASWRSPTQRRIERRHASLRTTLAQHLERRPRIAGGECRKGAVVPLVDLVLERGTTHPPDLIADLLIGAMLAAQRVPAAAAGWILMMLADHPELQEALQSEAADFSRSVDGSLPISAAAFPVAFSVVMETLRLYPPTWLITRVATRDTSLAGYHFRAGHMFMISPYVLHRDPELYEQPEIFTPQRWLTTAPPPATFLSFGRGRHRCPGADLTTTSLVALVLSLVSRYDIHRAGVVWPDPRNTLRPRGLRIHLKVQRSHENGTSAPEVRRSSCAHAQSA